MISIEQNRRRLPQGIQSFEIIRKEGYLYVDKTDLVWQLAHGDKFCYLSRPRRFGKSLLVDTLACYFEGRRELFEGLKMMNLEHEWVSRPVIRFDMSNGGETASELNAYLDNLFLQYERQYGLTGQQGGSLAVRFYNILSAAAAHTGQTAAVLIDEYDAPLLHSWHTSEHEACTAVYRSVFAVLKSATAYEHFVFLTGITKFTQVSLFSVLNNLTNVSFDPRFSAICGVTEKEVFTDFMPEIERMAAKNGWSVEDTKFRLKDYYDGYHFSADNMTDVYNPFSLVRALADGRMKNYWASSGATMLIPKFVSNLETDIREYENLCVDGDTLETSDVSGGAALFLYQSGYLTIKGASCGVYTLGIPNEEIRNALYKVVTPALTMRRAEEVQTVQMLLFGSLMQGQVDKAMQTLKALVADVPYSNKKLASIDMEERYRFIISSIFHAIGLRTEVEHMMAGGRIDIVASNALRTFVIELKLTKNGGLKAAEQQLLSHRYADAFRTEGQTVTALAIELDDEGKGVLAWSCVE